MKDLFFGFDDASRTYWVFTMVLISFVMIPAFYQILKPASLNRIQSRPLIYDWRFWIPMLVYSILLGLRYDYSFDWGQYKNTFEYLQRGLLFRDDTEKGYLFINRCLSLCGFNFYSIFILEAIIYVTSYYYLFKDNRKYLLFVMPIVYMAQYSNCLNISRQFFAMSVLFIAYRNLLEGKQIVYFILGLIACSIHSSAYIWLIVFYFLKHLNVIRINIKYIFIAYLISIIIITYYKTMLYDILSSMTVLISSKSHYEDGQIMDAKYLRDDMQFSLLLVHFVRTIMYLYLFKIQDAMGFFTKSPILKNYVLIGLVTYPVVYLMGTHEIFSRMMYYISVMADIGWGIWVYNYFFKSLKRKIVLWEFFLVFICTFQFLWAYYSQITFGFLNIKTNLFIIYK